MGEKEKLLGKLSRAELLELAKSLALAPIDSGTARAELIRIVKRALSVEEIKRKKREIEPPEYRVRRRNQFLAALVISVIVYNSLAFGCVSILNNVNVNELLLLEEKWSRTYDSQLAGYAITAEGTLDGGCIMIGYATISWFTYLVKTDSVGNVEWKNTIAGWPGPICVDQTSDGGFLIVGGALGPYDYPWMVKIGSNGTVQWSNDHIGPGNSSVSSVRQTSDGGYVIAGYVLLPPHWSPVFWVEKTDQSGNMLWNLTGKDSLGGSAFSAEETPDGGYIIAATVDTILTTGILVLKTGSNGEEQWSRLLAKELDLYGKCLEQTSDGEYVIGGFATWGWPSPISFWLAKIDQDGNVQWESANGGFSDKALSVQQTSDGGYILAGITDPAGSYPRKILLVKTDPIGHLEWERVHNGSEVGEVFLIQQRPSGGYAIAGTSLIGQTFWLAEFELGKPPALPAAIPLLLASSGLAIAACLGVMGMRLRRSRGGPPANHGGVEGSDEALTLHSL